MNYSRKYIEALNKDNNFIQNNLEKVVRLLDVLKFISTELDPYGDKLVLKGGTAINLMYTNLARLSVDIDLDYIGSLDKEKASQERDKIMDALDNYMLGEDYEISSKSRGSVILASRTYIFTNASHNRDNIKVEINFIDRIHIGPSVRKKINYFEKEVMVQTLLLEEVFGMKICALIDRSKPRDLFDVNKLKKNIMFIEEDKLRKMTVFYMSLDGIFDINEHTFDSIREIGQEDIKKELLPVLAKNSKFDLIETKEEVISFLIELLTLTDNEKKYLIEFSKGNFDPYLLFEPSDAERAAKHPMAKWRAANLKK
ncbi:MAG: nucleotidyl transferase AbiEii/AbiGii toxin family protein [Bacilli bacterium]|nr:nucleotidyl transferase AbiEii/AbiGii toxin family protein [Bacilli bacterium]